MKTKYQIIVIYIFLILLFILVGLNLKKTKDNPSIDKNYLATYFSIDEINYIINNNIDVEEIKPYLKYKYFNIYHFQNYQDIKTKYNLSYLESINYFNHPNYYNFYHQPKPALFLESPYTLVNKCFYLKHDFIPNELRNVKEYDIEYIIRKDEEIFLKQEALEQYQLMYNAAKKDGIELCLYSGYRSYKKQEYLYYQVYYMDDSISARPGFSEHQTGYAVDISISSIGLTEYFEQTSSYRWLINNSYKYGFILRFPKGKEKYTSYQFEPWHFRYVGEIAKEICFQELTLEEYIFSNFEI